MPSLNCLTLTSLKPQRTWTCTLRFCSSARSLARQWILSRSLRSVMTDPSACLQRLGSFRRDPMSKPRGEIKEYKWHQTHKSQSLRSWAHRFNVNTFKLLIWNLNMWQTNQWWLEFPTSSSDPKGTPSWARLSWCPEAAATAEAKDCCCLLAACIFPSHLWLLRDDRCRNVCPQWSQLQWQAAVQMNFLEYMA